MCVCVHTHTTQIWERAKYIDFEDAIKNLRGSPSNKNPPANAGNTDLIPGPGRSHMPQGNYAHAPQLLNPNLQQWEAQAPQLESSPCSSQLEKAHVQ